MGYLEQDFFVVVKVWAAGVGLAVLVGVNCAAGGSFSHIRLDLRPRLAFLQPKSCQMAGICTG